MGLLYGANTAGAVFGCLLAGFYLLRVSDMTTATFVAAAINAGVALASLALARRRPRTRRDPAAAAAGAVLRGYWPVYAGASRFPAPARWAPKWSGRACSASCSAPRSTRSPSSWPSSWWAWESAAPWERWRARSCAPARRSWAGARWRLAAAVAWTAWQLADSLPYWPINPFLSDQPLVHLPTRYGALPLGHPAGGAAVGREFSLRPGRGRARRRPGTPGGPRLRRQYRRRHRGRAGLQHDPDSVDRHALFGERADRDSPP